MRIYTMSRIHGKHCQVTVNSKPLPPRNDLFDYSPDGFEWSYGIRGPLQLALAILADHFLNYDSLPKEKAEQQAIKLHQDFKWLIIEPADLDVWVITSKGIDIALDKIKAHRNAGTRPEWKEAV